MGKKGLASIFSRLVVDSGRPSSSPAAGQPAAPPWPWPPCGTNPQTASFRAGAGGKDEPCCTTAAAGASRGGATGGANNRLTLARGAAPGEMYKTVNSVYLDDPAADVDFFSLAGDEAGEEGGEPPLPDLHDDADSFSTTTASEEWSEAVIRSLGRTSTDRFFFDDPGPLPAASNSILATAAAPPSPPAEAETTESETATATPPDTDVDDGDGDGDDAKPSKSLAEGSVAVAVDSGDPYGDFRASMEEMVSAHGLRDWASLEELLAWYLRINGKQHHRLIVGAFVDLLLGLASSSTSASSSSTSSSGSAFAGSHCTTSSTSTSASTAAATTSAAATAGGAATATTTAAAASVVERCGGGNEEEAAACCSSSTSSSSSSSCAAGPEHDAREDAAGEEGVQEEEKASSAATHCRHAGDG